MTDTIQRDLAKMYVEAATAVADVEYILFGNDDRFLFDLIRAENAVGKLPEMVEPFLTALHRALVAAAERLEAL